MTVIRAAQRSGSRGQLTGLVVAISQRRAAGILKTRHLIGKVITISIIGQRRTGRAVRIGYIRQSAGGVVAIGAGNGIVAQSRFPVGARDCAKSLQAIVAHRQLRRRPAVERERFARHLVLAVVGVAHTATQTVRHPRPIAELVVAEAQRHRRGTRITGIRHHFLRHLSAGVVSIIVLRIVVLGQYQVPRIVVAQRRLVDHLALRIQPLFPRIPTRLIVAKLLDLSIVIRQLRQLAVRIIRHRLHVTQRIRHRGVLVADIITLLRHIANWIGDRRGWAEVPCCLRSPCIRANFPNPRDPTPFPTYETRPHFRSLFFCRCV